MDARPKDLPFDPAAASPSEPLVRSHPPMALALQASFGSVERWREEFVAMGRAMGGGSGRVLLVFRPREGTLVNRCAADPTDAAAGGVPLLALDEYEHASRSATEDLHWTRVYERYQAAVEAASEPFAAAAEDLAGALVLDVRRRGVYEAAGTIIPGATWQDPGRVAAWAGQLPADARVVVYCVHGHEVGRCTALRLRAAGLDARFLRGGLGGWEAAGRPVAPRTV